MTKDYCGAIRAIQSCYLDGHHRIEDYADMLAYCYYVQTQMGAIRSPHLSVTISETAHCFGLAGTRSLISR